MGLFSSVLHLRDVQREQLLPPLDEVLRESHFTRSESVVVPAQGPDAILQGIARADKLCYLVSPLNGRWITVIEGHFGIADAPHLAEVGNRLSSELHCYALSLVVHDDDVFLYNLEYHGNPLDGYNSCPQYFEENRLPKPEVEEQRHTPEEFANLLPPGGRLDDLRSLLQRGWWNAHDTGRLDENGMPGDEDWFSFEEERMTAMGTLLQLHGSSGDYPYAAWGSPEKAIDWPSFKAILYRPL